VSLEAAATHVRTDGPTGSGGARRPPVVLAHGVGLDLSMWDLVVNDLAVDRLVVRYDLFGHGGSPDPPGPRTVGDLVAQCRSVLAETAASTGATPDLVGLSLGALVALATAARHPEAVRRLVAMNAVFDRSEADKRGSRERLAITEAEGLEPIATLAVDRWFAPDWQVAHPDRVAAVRNRLTSTDLDAYLKAYRLFVDGDPEMPAAAACITAPTLAVTGELDVGSVPAMSHAIAAAVPDGRSRVLSGLRHVPPIEAPESTVAVLRGFLDGESLCGDGTKGPEEDHR